jgi:hypothetical protein
MRDWAGLRADVDGMEKRKILSLLAIELQPRDE